MFEFYLAVSPRDARRSAYKGWTKAHLAYFVDAESGCLMRAESYAPRGGLMVVHCADMTNLDVATLREDIVSECLSRDFTGIFLDGTKNCGDLAVSLDKSSEIETVILPYHLIKGTKRALCTVSSGVTAGSLRRILERRASEIGQDRVLLDLERLGADITLPDPDGKALGHKDLNDLIREKRRGDAFYSGELFANYFTYKDEKRRTHFVIYDDDATLRRKLDLGRELGLRGTLALYSEVSDLLGSLR